MQELLNQTPNDLREEDFKDVSKVHDWRNYVPHEIRVNWINLTEREHKIIYLLCYERVDLEEWN